jgi:sugar-specific transcriptional regulator TrmB
MEQISLKTFGLKDKESEVYLALLKSGPSLANKLAKKTNLLRTTVYDYLDALIEKGFATYTIQGGKKYFTAINPEKLLDKFEERKQDEENTLKQLITQLSKIQNTENKGTNIEVYEGKEGMKTAMSWGLREEKKEILVYGSSGVSWKIIPLYMEKWHNERVRKKVKLKIIYNRVKETDERLKKGPTVELMEYKFSPIKDFSIIGTIIFTDRILLTIWDTETPIAIGIHSKEMSKNYKNNFEILWKNAKKAEIEKPSEN